VSAEGKLAIRAKGLMMTWRKVFAAAAMVMRFSVPGMAAAQDPQPAPATCIAIVMPSVTGAEGNAMQVATAVRDLFASYLSGPSMRAVALDARLPSQAAEEARQKQCSHLLVVKLTEKHRGRSVLGKAVGQAAGTAAWYIPGGGAAGAVVRGTAAGAAQAVSVIADSTHAKDEIQMQYSVTGPSGGAALLSKADKAQAHADREDLLTPLVERAATAIAAAVSGKK